MDTLTHTVIGACLGEAIAGKQLGKKAMLIGALANNFPDIDVISGLWVSEAKALLVHRGITHSILFNIILSFLLAWIFKKTFKKEDLHFSKWLLLIGSGLFVHIFIDAFTSYGTGWFEPFDDYRVSFNTIFILDPVFTLPVLIAAIVLLILKNDSVKRKPWYRFGLLASSFYLVLITINKIYVDGVVRKNMTQQNINYVNYMSTPTPLNNFLWYVVLCSDKEYKIGYYSIFDKNKNIEFENVQRNDSLLTFPCDPEQVADLQRFSRGYYCAKIENDTIVFSDMRFGQIGGWYKKDAPFVYNFKLAQNCSNKTALQKGRFASFNNGAMNKLFKRMFGEE